MKDVVKMSTIQTWVSIYGQYNLHVTCSGIKGKEIGNEKMVVIIDMKQLSYKNVDAHGLISGFQFLQVDFCF